MSMYNSLPNISTKHLGRIQNLTLHRSLEKTEKMQTKIKQVICFKKSKNSQKVSRQFPLKNEAELILTEQQKVIERWRQYCEDLML